MRVRALLAAWVLLFSAAAGCQSPFASSEDLQQWLTFYYQNPRPELAVRSLPALDALMHESKQRSLADEVGRGGLRSFYAQVFTANDAVVRELETSLDGMSGEVRAFVREALRRCGSSECVRVLGAPTRADNSANDQGGSTLDDSWAAFMATGDTRYVDEVIAVLPLIELRGDPERLILGGAARWSLASNASQHAKVLAACVAAANKSDATTARLLKEIVAEVEASGARVPRKKFAEAAAFESGVEPGQTRIACVDPVSVIHL